MAPVTLSELLSARDARAGRQFAFLTARQDKVLVCLTVSLPGPVKRDGRSLRIAREGVEAVRFVLHPVEEDIRDLPTGFEGYFLVDGTPDQVKRTCCFLEDSLPLGRLMDLDVILLREGMPVPLSRTALGLEERRCLLCERPARACMRAHSHSLEALNAEISRLLDDFANNL